jgi:hypothetical protein
MRTRLLRPPCHNDGVGSVWQRLDPLVRFALVWLIVRVIFRIGELLTGEGLSPALHSVFDIVDAGAILAIGYKFVVRTLAE